MKKLIAGAALFAAFILGAGLPAVAAAEVTAAEYHIGVDDSLSISILKPEPTEATLTVSPDGQITFPYIGSVRAKDRTLIEVQQEIQKRLGAYMNDPVVSISLAESRSRIFYVYGEVNAPGSFPLKDNMTAIRAISQAGGFTKFGSPSRVKILRARPDGSGNETIPVNLKAAIAGKPGQDVPLVSGDVIVAEEGF